MAVAAQLPLSCRSVAAQLPLSCRFLSRPDDAICLGGFLVDPHEVEKFIQQHPGVDICQMVGVEREGRTTAAALHACKAGAPQSGGDELRHFVCIEEILVPTSANNTKTVRAELRKTAERVLDGETLQA